MQTSDDIVEYRSMSEDDLEAAHRLSLAVGWPHRPQDWRFVLGLGTGYVAEDKDGIIGTVMCWHHSAEFATIGMVIVAHHRQGKGIGRKLMGLAVAAAGKRNILLNATASGLVLYQRLGFETVGQVLQHQGSMALPKALPLSPGERIRPFEPDDAATLAALEARATGIPRPEILTALLDVAQCVVIERDDRINGFAVLRRFGRGHVLGPVVAADIDGAKALISHWAGACTGSFVRIDIPAHCGLSAWLDEAGLAQVDSVVTMVCGKAPDQDNRIRQFGLISQALG